MSGKPDPRHGAGEGRKGLAFLLVGLLFGYLLSDLTRAGKKTCEGEGSGAALPPGAAGKSGGAASCAASGGQPWLDPVSPELEVATCEVPTSKGDWQSFVDIVKQSETDKSASLRAGIMKPHLYHTAYQKYFGPMRNRAVRLLEIGIGCGQQFVGASIPLWREYLPCVHLTMFEYNAKCAENYRNQVDQLVTGDQSNTADLDRALALGPYHLMVDDGGHTMKQQIVSLRHLFPTLPPGGVYVLEDMQTSVIGDGAYLDMPQGRDFTAVRFVADVVAQLHKRGDLPGMMEGSGEIARLTLNVDCIREACVLIRNDEKA